MNQRSDEWLKMRKNFLGASDAPIIMGCSPYMTPYELWLEKLGLGQEREVTAAMQRGIDLEALALEWFNLAYCMNLKPTVRFHRTIPYMMASLDGDNGIEILEIKCNGKEIHQNFVFCDEIPLHHMIQMQHQMEVCGVDRCYYLSFDGESGHKAQIRKEDKLTKEMLQKEAEFWECVTNLVPPTMTEKDRNRVQKDRAVDMSHDKEWNDLAMEYLEYSETAKYHQEKADACKNRMIELSRERNCYGNGVKLSRIEKKGSVDYESIPALKNVDLNLYRKRSTSYWKLEEVKEQKKGSVDYESIRLCTQPEM